MSTPTLSIGTAPARDSGAEVIALLLPPSVEGTSVLADTAYADWAADVESALRSLGFSGALGQTARVPMSDLARAILVVGTGADASPAALRSAAGTATRALTGVESIGIEAPGHDDDAAIAAILEGAGLGSYVFDDYKTSGRKTRAGRIVVTAASEDHGIVDRASAIIDAVALVKDLVNTPADRLSPAELAFQAVASVESLPVAVEVLDEDRLAADGYGGILGVGRGSVRPPRFVRLSYAPEAARRSVAVVGKGITFDTGGLSLKPPASMVGMKYDMAGAATALAVVRAVATLRLPVAVTALLCIADNMPSGSATRPGDVLTILDGTTVEVLNTDAEGRLVLADGLVAASREQPDLIIDVATLTGAVITALGTRHTGVMGDDDAVARFLGDAEAVDEPAWHLPLPAHMRDELESPIADLVNAKIGDPAGGALFAGLFLQRFVGTRPGSDDRIPWLHLDIAGSGTHKGSPYAWVEKGPTGAMTRAIIEHIRRIGVESAVHS